MAGSRCVWSTRRRWAARCGSCWRKRRWLCPDPACPVATFVEQDERVAAPRAMLTARACRWAIEQIRREHACVNGIRRQLGTGWRTVWESIRPLLAAADADPARFENVTILGVDEHVWHHVSTKPIEDGGRGPKELTGMVDLTRDEHGRIHARLLDLVPGRSGETYKTWLRQRGEAFRAGVEIATLDPFHGYKNAIDDQLEDARAVLDAFHVVKLATGVVDEVRRRVQQDIHGHRGRKRRPAVPDPEHPARRPREPHRPPTRPARSGVHRPTSDTSRSKSPGPAPNRSGAAYHQDSHAAGRTIAEKILDTFASCPIPEVARLGRTLRQWRSEFLGYFDTDGACNGGTEAINGLIELHRRIARGFRNRDNYRLRMLLIGGGLPL